MATKIKKKKSKRANGGLATVKKYGSEHMRKIGRKGGKRPKKNALNKRKIG